jgi:hypothetical protein
MGFGDQGFLLSDFPCSGSGGEAAAAGAAKAEDRLGADAGQEGGERL